MNDFAAHATFRSMQSAIDRQFPLHSEVMEVNPLLFQIPDPMGFITRSARNAVTMLEATKTPAANLTDNDKFSLMFLAGLMKYEDGKFVSIHPVGIADRGDGGYIIVSDPSR